MKKRPKEKRERENERVTEREKMRKLPKESRERERK